MGITVRQRGGTWWCVLGDTLHVDPDGTPQRSDEELARGGRLEVCLQAVLGEISDSCEHRAQRQCTHNGGCRVQGPSLVRGGPYPGPYPLSGPQFLICKWGSGPPYRAAGCIDDKSSKYQSSEQVSV